MRNYLRSIYSLLLLLLLFSQSVALLTKHLNHKSRRPNERVNYPSIQLSMLSDIYLTCVHAASSSSTLRVITQYFDISVRKKVWQNRKKNNSQNIDNKLKRFSISSWMTIAVPFFFPISLLLLLLLRLSTHNWQQQFVFGKPTTGRSP